MLNLKLCGRLILYADDAVLVYACNDWNELQMAMQADAQVLNEWFNRNILTLNTLNTLNTKYMTFGIANSLPDLSISFGVELIGRVDWIYKMINLRTKHNFILATNTGVHGRITRNCNNIHIFNPWSRRRDCKAMHWLLQSTSLINTTRISSTAIVSQHTSISSS